MNSIIKKIALTITFPALFFGITTVQAQGKSEATITLSYCKKADLSKTAVAVIKAKNANGKFVPAKNAHVNFYAAHGTEQQPIISANTGNTGQATVVIPKDLPLDDSLSFTIVAKIENDPLYEDASEQMHYKDANLILSVNPHDTTRNATVTVTKIGKDGKETPVKDVAVKFYVQRLFGIMPASDDNSVSTDEKGEATFAFPKNIPGDTAGVFSVVAKMEDNEQFGNVEKNAVTSWGTALSIDKDPFPRALWEPYAPLPLVITISTLFGGVWFTYFFIFFQLIKIKKENKENDKKA